MTPSTVTRAVITVRDVAERAGVHPGTVSRVLNPEKRHLISDATAQRVQQAAEELGYQANSIARGLRTRRSSTIGVVIPDLTNPIFPPIVRGIEDRLHPLGYTALLTNTDSEPEREVRGLRALTARQVDGFIVTTTEASLDFVANMVRDGVPVVTVNRTLSGVSGFAVAPDDRHGAVAAVEHLLDLGHRAIAHVGGPRGLAPGQERYRGYQDALREAGVRVPRQLVCFAEAFTGGAGVAPTRALLESGKPFTAVFAGNDLLALDCIDMLREAGLECPRDVSVVGFNDMPFADRFTPPLTTVHFSPYDIGREAAQLLMTQIEGDGTAPRTLVLPTRLVVRGSTAKPRSGGRSAARKRAA
jgi:LacI family transcriptional regulator